MGLGQTAPSIQSLEGITGMSRRRGEDYEDNENYRTLQRSLGDRIRGLRLARGLAQREFAERAGISATNYSVVEAGAGNVTLQVLDRVAKGLNVPIAALFDQTPGAQTAEMDGLIARLIADMDRVRVFFESHREEIVKLEDDRQALHAIFTGKVAPKS
jgi:transcriptional regulator with XRE-family HTH domain